MDKKKMANGLRDAVAMIQLDSFTDNAAVSTYLRGAVIGILEGVERELSEEKPIVVDDEVEVWLHFLGDWERATVACVFEDGFSAKRGDVTATRRFCNEGATWRRINKWET